MRRRRWRGRRRCWATTIGCCGRAWRRAARPRRRGATRRRGTAGAWSVPRALPAAGRGRRTGHRGSLQENRAKHSRAQENRERGRYCCQTHVRPPSLGSSQALGRQEPEFPPISVNPTLSGQFEAESTNPPIIRCKSHLPVTIPPAWWAAGQGLGLEYAAGDRAGQHVGGDGAEFREFVDRVGERPAAGRRREHGVAVERSYAPDRWRGRARPAP